MKYSVAGPLRLRSATRVSSQHLVNSDPESVKSTEPQDYTEYTSLQTNTGYTQLLSRSWFRKP